ncbi:MAG: histidinol-phosphate transaminase [Alphaproteobacteria bacterium]|nr:histidinol-phosphate transaminase [Alphaproteobacteria bacterium]
MSSSLSPRSSILNISPYVGGDVVPPGFIRRIGLSSNENPFGPSPFVKNIIRSGIDKIHFYPNSNATVLRQAIADAYNIDPSWILCGNGSEDTLHLLARTYATEGDEIIFAESAFGLYQIATLAVGAKSVVVPRENFKLNPEAVLKKITPQTKIIYLDHPGNPVGNFLHKNDLLKLIQEVPSSVLIVLDAAYAEYLEGEEGYTSGIELISEFSNVVMARTFSKAYALAGLRLGWIYANPKTLDPVNRIRPPFNVTSLTQSAGIEALKDTAWVKKAMDHNAVWRPWFEKEIEKLGLTFIPCYANFSMVNFGDKVTDVYQFLGKNGIIVRPMGAYDLPTYLRITIGQAHEMEELVDLLNKFYA